MTKPRVEEAAQEVRKSARMRADIASWYEGLGNGNFSEGLRRAFDRAHGNATPGPLELPTRERTGPSLVDLAGRLLPAWQKYNHPGLSDRQRLEWANGRLQSLLQHPVSGQQCLAVVDILRRLVRGDMPTRRD